MTDATPAAVPTGARRELRCWIIAGFVVVAATQGYVWRAYLDRPSNQGLTIAAKSLKFGELREASTGEWHLVLRNPTSQTVTIAGCSSSCTCASIEPQHVIIPPGGRCKLILALRMSPDDVPEPDGYPGDFKIDIVPRFPGLPPTAPGWTIRGKLK